MIVAADIQTTVGELPRNDSPVPLCTVMWMSGGSVAMLRAAVSAMSAAKPLMCDNEDVE